MQIIITHADLLVEADENSIRILTVAGMGAGEKFEPTKILHLSDLGATYIPTLRDFNQYSFHVRWTGPGIYRIESKTIIKEKLASNIAEYVGLMMNDILNFHVGL